MGRLRYETIGRWLGLGLVFAVPVTYPSVYVGVPWRQGFGFTLTAYVAVLALLVAWLVGLVVLRRERPGIVIGAPEVALGLVVLTNVASTLVSISVVRAIRLDLNLAVNAVGYLALRQLAADRNQIRQIIVVLAASALFVSLIGLLQYFFYDVTRRQIPFVPMFVVPFVGPRLQGTFEGPNYFGTYAVIALAPLLLAIQWPWSRWQGRLILLAATTLFAAGLLTFSRFNQVLMVMTLVAFLVLSWIYGGRRRAVISLLVVAGLLGLVTWLIATPALLHRTVAITNPLDDPNFNIRLAEYRRGVFMLLSHPLLGVGPGQATLYLPLSFGQPDVIHNDLVNRFAEGGVLGGAAFILFLGALLWTAVRAVQATAKERLEVRTFAVACLLALILAIADFQLYPRFYEPPIWLAYAMASGIGLWRPGARRISLAIRVPTVRRLTRQTSIP